MATRRSAPSDALAAWLARLEQRPGRRDGLAAVRAVAERLGVGAPAPLVAVVAGTNGKGSTTLYLEQLLLAAGRSVGATVSPHLHRFNERIRLNGESASDDVIAKALDAVEACRANAALSYFDYATLAALHVIAGAGVDAAVLEVGLGGRLDAVNVVDADVAVVTNVALDHQLFLGATREAIGVEKAGVLRPGKPVVVGESNPPATLRERAKALGAPMRLAGRDFGVQADVWWVRDGGRMARFACQSGAVAPINAVTAIQAAALLGPFPTAAVVAAATARAANPGRFEVVRRAGRTWVLDVAHNPAAAGFVADRLRSRFPSRALAAIVGGRADKDIAGVVRALQPAIALFAFVDIGGPGGRAGRDARAAAGHGAAFAGDLDGAVRHVLEHGREIGAILVCGSFDLIERMRARLHCVEITETTNRRLAT